MIRQYLIDKRKKLILEEYLFDKVKNVSINNGFHSNIKIVSINIISILDGDDKAQLYLRYSNDQSQRFFIVPDTTSIKIEDDLRYLSSLNSESHKLIISEINQFLSDIRDDKINSILN